MVEKKDISREARALNEDKTQGTCLGIWIPEAVKESPERDMKERKAALEGLAACVIAQSSVSDKKRSPRRRSGSTKEPERTAETSKEDQKCFLLPTELVEQLKKSTD